MAENGEKRSEEQSAPPVPPRPALSAGDHIAVNVGEGAAHVAAGKNIIQIGSLTVSRWAALLVVGALAAVAVLVGAVAWFNQQTSENTGRTAAILSYTPTPSPTITPVPSPTPTALPFAPAAEGETLIVVLPFHSTAATDSEPHKKIWREIAALVQEMPGKTVRVAIDPNVVLTADQQAEAERVGKLYNASMVIWGEDTGVELVASFLNLRGPDLAAADVDIQETERTQLANPSQYAEFVTRDLPGQMAFLSLFAVGQSYFLNNDYEAAVDTIKGAIAAVHPAADQTSGSQGLASVQGLADAYFRLGWLHQQPPADLAAAIADYYEAIELDPQYAAAYNNRGLAYSDQGDFAAAIGDLSKAIELDPQDADTYYNRGNVNYRQGNTEQALADYSKAIELNPQDPLAYYNRGNVYYEQGATEQALADYGKVIELDPQNALAYYNRGLAYYSQGALEQAIADYSTALELDPQDADGYNNRGFAYYSQGDYEQAIADYTTALELDPQNAFAYYNRGLAYFGQRDLERAAADYSKALELDPQNAEVHSDLCWTLALQQRAQEAIGHCDQATALADDPNYVDRRGLARALLGDYAAAAADFQTFLDWLLDDYPEETALIEQHKAWVEALRRGENPFTPQVLAELRGGSR